MYQQQPPQPQYQQYQAQSPKTVGPPGKKPEASKLSTFLSECLHVGSLKGFKYFELYLRGKEELLCRVYNKPDSNPNRTPAASMKFLSQKSKRMLFDQSAIQPASPSDKEIEQDSTKTAFLVAGYARYKRPYVWLRSNHAQLIKILDQDTNVDQDAPLRMDSVNDWMNRDVKCYEMIAELLNLAHAALNIRNQSGNPFLVEREFFEDVKLSLISGLIISSALIEFLIKMHKRGVPYGESVWADIVWLQQYQLNAAAELQERSQNKK